MNLFQHQIDGLKNAENLKNVAFFWDMGLGKTFVGAEQLNHYKNRVNLIICQKSKIQDWLDHFKTHYACKYVIFDLTKKKDLADFIRFQAENKGTPIIGVINYELSWRRKELMQLRDFTMMLDESSMIQNERAKRTKFILSMHPKNTILLSGTPTGGKYENLWAQMQLLGWKINRTTYWNTFIQTRLLDVYGGTKIQIVTGYKNVDRLKRKLHEYGCQFLKTDDVLDLPDQTFTQVKVPVTKEYKQFRKDLIVTVQDHELVGDTALTRMLYERELCGAFNKDKLNAVGDLFDSTNDRFVVFYNFNLELEQLIKLADEHNRLHGVVNGSKRNPEILNHDGAVLFVQYQAGAMGLNLQMANKVIYYTLPLSSELFEQSKKRIHRIGQKKPCFYYEMICTGSIEQHILHTLNQRKDYTERLFEHENH